LLGHLHAKRGEWERKCTFLSRGLRGFFIASFRLVIFGCVAAGFVGREGEEGGGEEDICLRRKVVRAFLTKEGMGEDRIKYICMYDGEGE